MHKADVPHLPTSRHSYTSLQLVALLSHISLTSVQTVLVFAQHEHDFPLEYIAPHQTTADSGNVLVGLDLLELLCQ